MPEPYRVGGLLGQGGMGAVYRAWDVRLERFVALKMLRVDDEERARRLLAEACAQARVEHPYVCKVYNAGMADGRPWVAMQLIEGATLESAARVLQPVEVAEIGIGVAEALDAAHEAGLVHRDVKPSNVLLRPRTDGRWHPYLADFGLARQVTCDGAATAGRIVGTPSYMAPEHVRRPKTEADPRADVWSLGATLYFALSGAPPVGGDNPAATLTRLMDEDFAPPALPASVPAGPARPGRAPARRCARSG